MKSVNSAEKNDQILNIAGKLPEKSQNSFVDLQSQKEIEKETHQRRNFFLLNAEMLQFD